jgi:predicted PurR-regulated permease PerM
MNALDALKNILNIERLSKGNILRNDRLQQILLIIGYMLIAAGALWGLSLIYPFVLAIINIVSPFLLAFILAYVFNPLLTFAQEKFKLTREGAVVIGTVGIVGTAGVATFLILLIVFQQGYDLIGQIEVAPKQLDRTLSSLNWFDEDAEEQGESSTDETESENKDDSSASTSDESTSQTATLEEKALDEGSSPTTVVQAALEGVANELTEATAPPATVSEKATRKPSRAEYAGIRPGHKTVPVAQSTGLLDSFWNWVSPPSNPITGAATSPINFEAAASGGVSFARQVGVIAVGILNWLLSGLVFLSFTGVVTFFMLLDFNTMTSNFWKIVPVEHRDKTAEILARIDYALGGYLRGQISVCFVVGIIWTLWLILVLGLYQYALLIGFVTGLMNFVPYLGAFTGLLSGILYVLLGDYTGIGGPMGGIALVILGFAVLQAIEGFVLQPLLVGKKAELHPLIIIFALLLGSQFGIAGMLLAVPVAVIIRVLLKELFWKHYMRDQAQKMDDDTKGADGSVDSEEYAREAMLIFKKVQLDLDEKAREGDWVDDLKKPPIKAVTKVRKVIKEKQYTKRQREVESLDDYLDHDAEELLEDQLDEQPTSNDPEIDEPELDDEQEAVEDEESELEEEDEADESEEAAEPQTQKPKGDAAPPPKRKSKSSRRKKGSFARSRKRKKSSS